MDMASRKEWISYCPHLVTPVRSQPEFISQPGFAGTLNWEKTAPNTRAYIGFRALTVHGGRWRVRN